MATLVGVLVPSSPAPADIFDLGRGMYAAGVPSKEFDFFAAPRFEGRQRQQNWCWAACVQMTLNYHGLQMTQEDVIQRIFGAQVDAQGSPEMILEALSGWAPDERGRYSAIHASPYVKRGSDIVRDLAHRWPLIVGLTERRGGHAYVLTAVEYTVDPRNNEPIFHGVVLRDPMPGRRSEVRLDWPTFERKLTFMARVSVARH